MCVIARTHMNMMVYKSHLTKCQSSRVYLSISADYNDDYEFDTPHSPSTGKLSIRIRRVVLIPSGIHHLNFY